METWKSNNSHERNLQASTFLDERIFLTDRGTMQNYPGFMLIVHFSNQLGYKEVAFKVRTLHI